MPLRFTFTGHKVKVGAAIFGSQRAEACPPLSPLGRCVRHERVCCPCLPPMLVWVRVSVGAWMFGLKSIAFLKLVIRGFLRVLRFPPPFHRLVVSANKIYLNKWDFNSVKLNSSGVPLYHVAHVMLHVIKGPAHAATFAYCNPQYRACNNRRPPCSKPAGLAGGLQGDRENFYPCKKVAVL